MSAKVEPQKILLTGATGAIGGRLLPELLKVGGSVRALARKPQSANLGADVEVVKGDVFGGVGLDAALDGVDVAYYLVHAMGRGNTGDFAELDRRGAHNFGKAAQKAGVRRIVYLGALEGPVATDSHHLQSRAEVAEILADYVPEPIHARSAMVIAADSQSFLILQNLVHRLPVMVCPKWVDTKSQPIAGSDVSAALTALASLGDPPKEVQLGGGEVLAYREMMLRTADGLGRFRPPMLPVPVMTPRLSSRWVSLFGGVEYPLVRPLVDGLKTETVVTVAPPAGVNDSPKGFDEAVAEALGERKK